MDITLEQIEKLNDSEKLELFNNTLVQKAKLADGEGMKRGLSLVDNVLDELEVAKIEGQKTSDRAKSALLSRKEKIEIAEKKIEELGKSKGNESEAVANLRRELQEAKDRAELLAKGKTELENSYKLENENRVKQAKIQGENALMLKKLAKGSFGEGVTGEIKDSFLNGQISKIRENYVISENSEGKLQFHDREGNLKTAGATNAPANVLDIALLNDSFKSAYSEKKVITKIDLKNNEGSPNVTVKQYKEQLNTQNIPESEKQRLLMKFALANK